MVATSSCIPRNIDFFEINTKSKPDKINLISGVLKIEGIGTAEYTIEYGRGSNINLRVWDFYVPQLSINPQIIFCW